jgi:hypothetical protein
MRTTAAMRVHYVGVVVLTETEYGFDWYTPSGLFSGWSGGPVPDDLAALGWYSTPRRLEREGASDE